MDSRTISTISAAMTRDALGLNGAHNDGIPSSPKFSRRQFLATGVLVSGALQAAPTETCPVTDLQFCRVTETGIALRRQALLVSFGQLKWLIEPQLFGPDATLQYEAGETNQMHRLELKNAQFPGVDLQVDFSATLYRSGGIWIIRLRFDEVGQQIECTLEQWMTRAPAARYEGPMRKKGRKIRIGVRNCSLTPQTGAIRFAIDASMNATLSSEDGLLFTCRRFEFAVGQITCSPVKADAVHPGHTSALAHASGPFTNISLQHISSPDSELPLVNVGRILTAHIHFGATPSATLVGHGHGDLRDATFVLGGATSTGTLVVRGGATPPSGTRIALRPWAVLGNVNRIGQQLRFAATLAQHPCDGFPLETNSVTALVSGIQSQLIELDLSRPLPSLNFNVQLRGAHIPIPGVSAASIEFTPAQALWVTFGEPAVARPENKGLAHLHVENGSVLDVSLDAAMLRIRRSVDCFDLSFRLSHYSLRVSSKASEIIQRVVTYPVVVGQPQFPCMVVQFHPQHEFEEVFQAPDEPLFEVAAKGKTDSDKTPMVRGGRRKLAHGYPELARTRLANESRLVFELPVTADALQHRALTLDWLTDWTDAKLTVNPRALARSAGLKEQLALTGIDPTTSRDQARELVRKTILGANLGMPGKHETAIEAVYRMIVSPDKSARFVVVPQAKDARYPLLWRVEMENHADVATRALWARGMDPSLPFFDSKREEPAAPFDLAFTGSLEANDRRELVAMTSFYGVAALRRLIPVTQGVSLFTSMSRAVGLSATPPSEWKDDPNGMVFLPDFDQKKYPNQTAYAYLSKENVNNVPQEGVMQAKPFDRFRLRMGRAADMDAFWKGEPPAQMFNDPFFHPAFIIERYSHRTVQGRDVFVEVLYKGFLFPLGHRASFIKVSYRDFKSYMDRPDGDPTAYLVQELYIVCNKPIKHFRAYGQPYDSHDFPCEKVTLLTTRTGKLADIDPLPLPNPPRDQTRPEGRVFWPTLAATGKPVIFSYLIDGQSEPAHSPLMFIDNAAAHDQVTISLITEKFKSYKRDDPLRIVTHGQAVRRYAPEEQGGQCSFKTLQWVMSVRGRINPQDGRETYTMDAFMEGQDQPPFYPVVEEAQVNVESVERLTGQTGQYITTAFNSRYVQFGFDGAHNPSEIFMDVITPDLYLNGNASPGDTGGVASMAALLAGLSRKIGPVGGQRAAPVPASGNPLSLSAVRTGDEPLRPAPLPGGPVRRQMQMDSAMGGGFNPLEFLGDAKLLGCIPLKDVCMTALIAGAPKLLEQVKHGIHGVEDALVKIKAKLAIAVDALTRTIKDCRAEIDTSLAIMHAGLTLKGLYAGLDHSLTSVQAAIDKARAMLNSSQLPDLDALQDLASEVKIAVDELVHELESIVRDPVPSIIKDSLAEMQTIWGNIRNPGETLVKDIADLVVKLALDTLLGVLCARDNRYLLRAIFGATGEPLPHDTDEVFMARIKALLLNPAEALDGMRDALLYESFAKPMFELLQSVTGAAGQTVRTLSWSRGRVVNAITGLIRRNAASLPADRFTAIAETIANEIEQALNKPGDIVQSPQCLTTIVEKAVARGLADVDKVIAQFKADMATELANTTDAIKKYLAQERDGAVDEIDREYYRQLQGRVRKLADMAHDLDVLVKSDRKAIGDALVAEARAELERAVADKLKEIEKAAQHEAGKLIDSAVDLVNRLFTLLESWSVVRALQRFGGKLGDICQNTAPKLTKALDSVAFGFMADEVAIARNLTIVDDVLNRASLALDTLAVPAGQPAAIRDTMQANLTTLMTAAEAMRRLCARSKGLRSQWNDARPGVNCKIDVTFDLARRIAALRADVPGIITSALAAVARFTETAQPSFMARQFAPAPFDFKTEFEEVEKALLDLLGGLTGLVNMTAGTAEWREHKVFIAGAGAQVKEIDAHLKALEALSLSWKARVGKALAVARAIQGQFEELDRQMVAVVVQMILPQKSFIVPLDTAILTLAHGVAKYLEGPHGTVSGAVASFEELIKTTNAGGIALTSLLSQDLPGRLKGASDALWADTKTLKEMASADVTVALADANQLSGAWKEGRAGLVLAVKLVGDVVELVTSGNVMALFNVGQIEKELRIAVAGFLPTKIKLSYDFDAALSDFPASNPIFTMDRASYGTQKESKCDDEGYPVNDLVLTTRIDIDLLTGERSVNADGRLRPFTLNLLGGALDLIGISFCGAHFQAKAGGKLAIDTKVSGVRIGAMLEFLSPIQSYFSSGTKNGLYYDLTFLPPALEVGYRFNQPYIGIGTMSLLNIGFKVGAMLPLDGRQAEFFCCMSSREYPLLIVMTPYGGGGFFGLRCTAQGIIAIEIQLEFGFVGALEIGPLSAQARATAGIYLMQGQGQRVLEGFFHAIGEGHLACFGVGVNIEIKMRQESNGSMEGSATYSYSFSVGFFDIEFEVVASRRQDNGSGGGNPPATIAAAGKVSPARAMEAPLAGGSAPVPCSGADKPSLVKNNAVRKDQHWNTYRTFLDLTEAP